MNKTKSGFTIVELLIVIVIIAILAAISIVAYNGMQQRARSSKVQSDLAQIERAIILARESRSVNMFTIIGSGVTENGCLSKASGTDLAALPSTDNCWTAYRSALTAISNASGMNINNLVDPYGRPYMINANEGENQTSHLCMNDRLGTYRMPHVVGGMDINRAVPLYSTTC